MSKNKRKNKNRSTTSAKKQTSLSAIKSFQPLIIVAVVSSILLVAANIQTTQKFTASAQNVLGEDEQSEEQKQAEEQQEEADKQAEEAEEESLKQAEEQQKEGTETTANTTGTSSSPRSSIKSKTETVSPSGLKMKTESEDEKQETEIETADGQKIKTKVEDDGTSKIEIENGTVKLKYFIVNGQVVLNVENEDGDEVEIEDDELEELEYEVEDELEDDNIRLVPTTGNQLALTQNEIAALTHFPLSINVETKELIITTPKGQKIVTVLPNEAVQNLLATGIINSIQTPPSELATQDQLGALTGVVEIEMRDSEIVYKIKGKKTHRMLGIIPVTTPVTAFVSTETGLTVAKQQSILTSILDFLSP